MAQRTGGRSTFHLGSENSNRHALQFHNDQSTLQQQPELRGDQFTSQHQIRSGHTSSQVQRRSNRVASQTNAMENAYSNNRRPTSFVSNPGFVSPANRPIPMLRNRTGTSRISPENPRPGYSSSQTENPRPGYSANSQNWRPVRNSSQVQAPQNYSRTYRPPQLPSTQVQAPMNSRTYRPPQVPSTQVQAPMNSRIYKPPQVPSTDQVQAQMNSRIYRPPQVPSSDQVQAPMNSRIYRPPQVPSTDQVQAPMNSRTYRPPLQGTSSGSSSVYEALPMMHRSGIQHGSSSRERTTQSRDEKSPFFHYDDVNWSTLVPLYPDKSNPPAPIISLESLKNQPTDKEVNDMMNSIRHFTTNSTIKKTFNPNHNIYLMGMPARSSKPSTSTTHDHNPSTGDQLALPDDLNIEELAVEPFLKETLEKELYQQWLRLDPNDDKAVKDCYDILRKLGT